MRVLLTRPEAGAATTIRRLREAGHEVVHAPLLEIVATHGVPHGSATALIATSAHAFDCLDESAAAGLRSLPAYIVGERTADAARARGFVGPTQVAPDAASLAHLIKTADLPPTQFLYLAGRDRRPTLEESLTALGHSVEPWIVYEARHATHLPAAAADALRAGNIDAVLHFSPRSAAAFLSLAREADILDSAMKPIQVTISSRTAEELAGQAATIRIAGRPDLDAMIDGLRRAG